METVTSPQKPYIISLEVATPDGHLRSCEFKVTPTGSYATEPGWFWMQLHGNLHAFLDTAGDVERVSSRVGLLKGLVS